LPGVEEGPSHGTPGFRVHGKFLARLREDDASLAVKCGHEERDAWLRAKPQSFFITEHYRGYPAVLVNLATVELADLRRVLEQAWRRGAPKRVIAGLRRATRAHLNREASHGQVDERELRGQVGVV